MEQLRALRQMESSLSLLGDHVSVLSGKLEDLLFRAQRIAHEMKENPKAKAPDSMFGYDLQAFRRDVRAFSNELGGLATLLGNIERGAQFDELSLSHAQAVMRLSDRLNKALAALMDKALLAHQHIRQAEHKVEAWYMSQEIEALVQSTQGLPTAANRIIIAVSDKRRAPLGQAAPAPAPQASSPQADPPRKASVPMRPAGTINPVPPPKPQP